MTDAMGHAVNAAVLASVLVGGLRNARRAGVGLAEQADRASEGLGEYASWWQLVTGQVARIELSSGVAAIVNAGHPPPLRVRDGRVEPVALAADPPFGTVRGWGYRVQPLPLQAGDRLMFLTDGMLERNGDVDIDAVLLAAAHDHPRAAVQHLVQAVKDAHGGPLGDDATALCLDWHGSTAAWSGG
jgi:serine phosphatase RsbU (regulator of sigma subunit)